VTARLGIDLVFVDLVRESLDVHANRYLERVFTQREVAECTRASGDVDVERLAARFAAKEATLKVLRPANEGVPLNAIEVVSDRAGSVDITLTGPAAALAERAGIAFLALSMTHESSLAAAVVFAELDAPDES
jgi:holo-[acyl-carrier protein] synthase